MTTRFSVAELATMLGVSVDLVRAAVDDLASKGELTAESFAFQERNWRIAPSDIKAIQGWIGEQDDKERDSAEMRSTRVRKKVIRRLSE